jgi:hypothetical protein
VFTARYGLGVCVLCGSQNKQQLFPYTALTDWFLTPRRRVFTARYGLSPSIYFRSLFKEIMEIRYGARSGSDAVTRSKLSKAVALVASSRKKEPAGRCEVSVPSGQRACCAVHKVTV